MKLIIREYLGMLRESGEFDAIFPDLLLEMSLIPISKPQVGVRQGGVDIAAVGPDETGKKALWLFVLKRGDLGRRDWNSQPQSVRQSLDEIKDVYIKNHIAPKYANLPIKIIVATTGDFKQDFEQDRVGYMEANTTRKLKYDFWNGDQVSVLLEKYLLNEYALPNTARSKLRSTLALIVEPDYTLDHFFSLLDILLERRSSAKNTPGKKIRNNKRFIRSLVTTSLTLAIVCRWAGSDGGNIRNAVIACERTLLWTWDSIREKNLTQNHDVVHAYWRLVGIYLTTTTEYFNKVQDHLHTQDAISHYYSEAVLLKERVFEEIGFIASLGLSHLLWGIIAKDEEREKGASFVANTLKEFFKTHPCSGSPCYDHQVIDISLAVLFLVWSGQIGAAKEWLQELSGRLIFSFKKNKWFPISTDSFDDLLEFEIDPKSCDIQKLKDSSWMIPTIAQWLARLKDDNTYAHLIEMCNEVLKECCFQLWYPDKKTEECMYKGPAHLESGISEAPIFLPLTGNEMRVHMKKIQEDSPVKNPFESSAVLAGMPWLDAIASRHFRTPMNPMFWQKEVEYSTDGTTAGADN